MTPRSTILALLGVVLLSAFCYFFDGVIRQGLFVSSLMPVAVYGSLVLVALLLQPLLHRFRRRPFRTRVGRAGVPDSAGLRDSRTGPWSSTCLPSPCSPITISG